MITILILESTHTQYFDFIFNLAFHQVDQKTMDHCFFAANSRKLFELVAVLPHMHTHSSTRTSTRTLEHMRTHA